MREGSQLGGRAGPVRSASDGALKRAAVEMIARYEPALRRTARRYSIDVEDADDAYQRALEIVLTKAPTTDLRELIRWTQTVTKHEALAVRRSREAMLGFPSPSGQGNPSLDPVALIPAEGDGPDEQVERRETIARSREALRALKPAELRTLTLLAAGYSYAEIGERTGFSRTKINRCLAEGRERFRKLISSSEDGSRCRELRPLLSAFCDGEASKGEAAVVREHLRACAHCRATMRTYRAAPRTVAVLAPVLPASRSLFERAQELLSDLGSRLSGLGGRSAGMAQVTAAGSRGIGTAPLAKLLTLCAGVTGGAACMATGVLPAPLDLLPGQSHKQSIERRTDPAGDASARERYEPGPPIPAPQSPPRHPAESDGENAGAEADDAAAGTVEYEPPPPPAPAPVPPPASGSEGSGSTSSSGSAAGEFGP